MTHKHPLTRKSIELANSGNYNLAAIGFSCSSNSSHVDMRESVKLIEPGHQKKTIQRLQEKRWWGAPPPRCRW